MALAPVSPAESGSTISPLASALADSLKISFHAQGTPETQLITYLRRREMLLVLDNFEHLLSETTLIAQILLETPDIKLLVTSRERLQLQEEWLFPLYGLHLE